MKTRHIAVLLLIMAAGSACRVLKEKHRAQTEIKTGKRSDVQAESSVSTSLITQQASLREDSLWQEYRVTIFPADSFSYDPERGFSGRAMKVEISGKTRHYTRQQDTLAISGRSDSDEHLRSSAGRTEERLAATTERTVTRNRVAPLFFIAGLIVLVAGAYRMTKRLKP